MPQILIPPPPIAIARRRLIWNGGYPRQCRLDQSRRFDRIVNHASWGSWAKLIPFNGKILAEWREAYERRQTNGDLSRSAKTTERI